MNIIGELSEIAAAKYGLQLKDPIFKAFDRLVTDPKFELIKDLVDDDFADFDNAILSYQTNNTTTKTLRNILNLIYILNGRKGYQAKRMVGHTIPQKEHIAYWIDMLAKELLNSSNDNQNDGVAVRGSGLVNGVKMRAAIYHILDILQYDGSIYNDSWVVTLASPCCVFGRGVYRITINGTASGVGYLNTEDEKYYVDLTLRDMFMVYGTNQTYTIEIGDEPLGEGDTVTFDIPNGQNLPYSLYLVTIEDFTTEVQLFYVATKEKTYIPGAVREKTATPPYNIYTVDTSLLDWAIIANSNKVGKVGKNKLKQRTTPIPNGAVGTIETDSGWYTESAHQGITFTTGNNIIKGSLTIRHSDNSDISASSQIGDIMLVEGDIIPTAYDADTNLYSGTINQGYYMDEESGVRVRELGYSQSMATTVSLSIRCCSDYFSLKPNTTYSVRLFNSAYNDIQFVVNTYSAPGTITPKFVAVGGKSIPGNATFVTDTEQWVELTYSHRRTKEYEVAMAFDMRPIEYEYCESFADLKAGTYKLMIDIWGNNEWYASSSTGYVIGFNSYTGCTADNWDWDGTNLTEWFTLLSENNTAIISKTDIFEAGTVKYKAQSAGAPFPNYYHREFTFTLSEDTKVGLFHRAYYESPSTAYPPYFRFMIVDSDVEAVDFETTGVYPENMTGYSAWEPFKITIGLQSWNEDLSLAKQITIYLDDFLSFGESVTKTTTSLNLETFEGWNTITVNTDGDVLVYVKYQQ